MESAMPGVRTSSANSGSALMRRRTPPQSSNGPSMGRSDKLRSISHSGPHKRWTGVRVGEEYVRPIGRRDIL